MFFSKSLKNIDDREYLGKEEYTILKTPNDRLLKYKGLKFSTLADLFIYKNQNYVNDNMRWLEIQTFKLYYDKKYYLQCLYIKNKNSINKAQVMLYSQCFYTNFASSLPFLIDLSNYLRVNIITYEYNNKDKQDSNYYDVNILYHYLSKIQFINNIILLGLSIGNKINMSVMLSKINNNLKSKLKAFIFISPTWVYNLADLKKIKNFSTIRGDVGEFLEAINKSKIPIFIIHGKQDLNVKYFLSLSFIQKIDNKFEWFPKNGTHFDIINEHRKKLLIKLKQFFLNYNLLNNGKGNFDTISKMNEEIISNNNNDLEERKTAFFIDENKNKIEEKKNAEEKNIININNEFDDYYRHYNNNDIMGGKKNSKKNINAYNKNGKENNINNDELYTVCHSKIELNNNNINNDITTNANIKDYNDIIINKDKKDDITINQDMKDDITVNQDMKDDITLNQKIKKYDEEGLNNKNNYENISIKQKSTNSFNITLNNNMEYDNITINQSIIQYDENENDLNNIPRISTVSFIPGDIIPTFKNKNANVNQSFIYRKPTNKNNRAISFVSFNV